MEILSRTDARVIDQKLYQGFLQNDYGLAASYAFDLSLHQRNRVTMSYNNLQYDILGENISLQNCMQTSLQNCMQTSLQKNMEAIQIEILCSYPIDIRLDKLLSRKLMVSREALKRMSKQQKICVEGLDNWEKQKLKNGIRINILP
jgi:hypothetical protein